MVNNTVIDWFQPWPAEALRSVADKFLSDVDLPEDKRAQVTSHMMFVHESVLDASVDFEMQLRRYNYVTPKNYLTFIATYKRELTNNRTRNHELVERLDGGLKKLIQAAKDVAIMQTELAAKTIVVNQKTLECGEMLQTISINTKEATEKQEAAAVQEEELGVKSIDIAGRHSQTSALGSTH
jgi:dynein heavy chain